MPIKLNQTFPDRKFWLYINADGSQYTDENHEIYDAIPEGHLPDGVEPFSFTIRTLSGSDSLNAASHASEAFFNAQLNRAERRRLGRGNADAQSNFDQRLIQMISAIVEWDVIGENGQMVQPSADALRQLRPGWIFEHIQIAHGLVNSAKNLPIG